MKQETMESPEKAGGSVLHTSALERRALYLWGAVNDESSGRLIREIHHLTHVDPQEAITLFLNCPGGATHAGFAILDAMQSLKCDFRTVCTGMAASFGALILMCGSKGQRFVTPRSKVMIHQPHIAGQIEAAPADLRIFAENMSRERVEIARLIASVTGQSLERVEVDCDRDTWFYGAEAIEYGMADAIWGS